MSKLYGSLLGCRGPATRCGSRDSGIRASVQSWDGSLVSYMDLGDNDTPIVTLRISNNSSEYGDETVFKGTLDELKAKLKA